MKKYLFLSTLTITSALYCTEIDHKNYTKLIEAIMIQNDNTAASIENDNHKIEIVPTILQDGSINTKLVIWEKN